MKTIKMLMHGSARSKFLGFLIVLTLAFGAYLWLALNWTFSEGERVGYVQKISLRGLICKTWEGEQALVAMPGGVPEIFHFSIRDDKVAKQIENLAGERVALSYKQHGFIPTKCFGDTTYFVDQVRKVNPLVIPGYNDQLNPSEQVPTKPEAPASAPH